MPFRVEVISKQTIKPSSPAPHHLQTLRLSFLDQWVPGQELLNLILFYPIPTDGRDKNEILLTALQTSLSETLTQFYPLAGRLSDNEAIDCNDEGVDFFQTRINCQLDEVVSHPVAQELDMLLPCRETLYGSLGLKVLLSVQANIFDCGGIALGICIVHKVLDASSLGFFLNTWAAVVRGNETLPPEFDNTSLFPPNPKHVAPAHRIGANEGVTKRLVFDPSTIAALKAKCSSKLYIEKPTRMETVIAFIWKCLMNMGRMRMKTSESGKSASVAHIVVNLRGRMIPPESSSCVGNLVIGTMATSSYMEEAEEEELQCLAAKLRAAIRKVNAEFATAIAADMQLAYEGLEEMEAYVFSSWCRFPYYEVDLGWGKPLWIARASLAAKNDIVLLDTKCGTGVEASICLGKQEMDIFERDLELTANSHLS